MLAKSEEGYPLLIAQPMGRGRVAALAVDTTFLLAFGRLSEGASAVLASNDFMAFPQRGRY